jgi:hypothetical protein
MEIAFAKNVKKYRSIIAMKLGKVSQKNLLGMIGSVGEGDVRQTIADMKSPPNSLATIKRKGTNDPLVDTSHMFSSVSHSVEAK